MVDTTTARVPRSPYATFDLDGLLASDHVSAATRRALTERRAITAPPVPRVLSVPQMRVLRAVAIRLVPQDDQEDPVDLADRIDARLAAREGDGWRYGALPPDAEAIGTAMVNLDQSGWERFSAGFADLPPERQDEILAAMQRGEMEGQGWEGLSPALIFEELLVEMVETFYAGSRGQRDIGYAGMADLPGWDHIGLDERDLREPIRVQSDNRQDRTGQLTGE